MTKYCKAGESQYGSDATSAVAAVLGTLIADLQAAGILGI